MLTNELHIYRGCAARRMHRAVKNTSMLVALGESVAAVFANQSHASDSFAGSVLEDTKLYFTAPLRWDEEDWLYFGGALLAIGAAHQFDGRVRDHFATGSKAILNEAEEK